MMRSLFLIALLSLGLGTVSPAFAASQILYLSGSGEEELSSDLRLPSWDLRETRAETDPTSSSLVEASGGTFETPELQEGSYSLEVSDALGARTLLAQVEVGVDPDLPTENGRSVSLEAFPPVENGSIQVTAETQRILLVPRVSGVGEVNRYHLDLDPERDNNGDGDLTNDSDNRSNIPSLQQGSAWSAPWDGGEGEITLTVYWEDGSIQQDTVLVSLSDAPVPPSEELVATLTTVPSADAAGSITLGSEESLIVSGASSQGDISEYWIDANTVIDSDGDGDPENDADNRGHPSFTTGGPWTVPADLIDRENGGVIQLIIVGRDASGSQSASRIQRRILPSQTSSMANSLSPVALILGKSVVLPGEVVELQVFGAPNRSEFLWDLDGDSNVDETTTTPTLRHIYEREGVYEVSVQVQKSDLSTSAVQSIEVREPTGEELLRYPPIAEYEIVQEQNKISLQNLSRTDPLFSQSALRYDWDFGDGSTSTEQSPTHIYSEPGEYILSLTVRDDNDTTARTSQSILVADLGFTPPQDELSSDEVEDLGGLTSPQTSPESSSGGVFSWLIWGLLWLIVIGLILGLGVLIWRKIQHPDATWAEIMRGELGEDDDPYLASPRVYEPEILSQEVRETEAPTPEEPVQDPQETSSAYQDLPPWMEESPESPSSEPSSQAPVIAPDADPQPQVQDPVESQPEAPFDPESATSASPLEPDASGDTPDSSPEASGSEEPSSGASEPADEASVETDPHPADDPELDPETRAFLEASEDAIHDVLGDALPETKKPKTPPPSA